jgi:hypothetical protein
MTSLIGIEKNKFIGYSYTDLHRLAKKGDSHASKRIS